MNLSVLSIRRPVLATVLSIVIVLIGVVGFLFLGVRQFPDVDPPIINVTTTYAGANADVIESQITEPIEESVNGIAGIRSITSTSSDGRSNITVEFELGEDLEAAANDVRDRVARAQRLLPPDADPPIVAKQDANSQAIMVMTVQSDDRTLAGLTDIATNVFKERLQTIPGVSGIQIWGERKYAIRLLFDPDRLAAYGLTSADVRSVLARENVELPAGRLEGTSTELSIRTVGRLGTVEQFEDVIVRSEGGAIVRLRDVARVYLGAENERTLLKRDGRPMVGLALSPLPGANQVDIAEEFNRRLEQLKDQAPKDITLDVAFDNTVFIKRAVSEVEETLVIAFGLVVLIIFLFLRTWRATIIPVVAIPVSLVSSFFFMWIFGFSINVLTLLGIVLATGLVVDDAIVMMENIYKRIEDGESPAEAGEKGSTEISFAIISTTVTLVVVFIPIIFLQGLSGRLFREFGVVVAASVAVSAFVSLTLTPMMSTRLLRRTETSGWLMRVTEPVFLWMNDVYARGLGIFVRRPLLGVALMLATVAGLYGISSFLKSELPPLEDKSLITMNVTAPEGYTYDRMDMFMDTVTALVTRAVPEKHLVLTVTSPSFFGGGANSGFARLILKDPEDRTRSQQDIAKVLTKSLAGKTEARTIVIQEQTISTGGGRAGLPVQYVIQAPDMERMREILPKFLEQAQKDPTFTVVDVNLKFTKPEVELVVNRARARELGVNVGDIGDAIQAGFAGQRYGYFVREGKQYQVIGEIERALRTTPDQLQSLQVRSADGSMIPLVNLVTIKERTSPPQLYRYNRYVSATVSAGLAEGKTIADGIATMDRIAGATFSPGVQSALTGPSRDFVESSSSILYAFLLALILVYLILAAQFESFIDPLIILLTVPLALAGAAFSLVLTGETMNIFSQIGAITLIGLVTKNGILIVEFANQIRERDHVSYAEAVFEAAKARFRPILMTSLATILGALPIALSLGAASGSRIGLGVVVVGGMIFSTFLTLIVIPSIYVLFSRIKPKRPSMSGTVNQSSVLTSSGLALLVAAMLCGSPYDVGAQNRLSLDDAIAEALKNSYAVRLSSVDSLLARNTGQASMAGYLPTAVVTAGTTRGANDLSQTLSSGTVIERPGAGFSTLNANLGVTWTLFDGLRMFAEDDRLRALKGAAEETARHRMSLAVADVIAAYANVVRSQTLLRTAHLADSLVTERYDIEQRRYAAGLVSAVELSQAAVDKSTVAATVIRLRTDLQAAREALSALLGRGPLQDIVVDTSMAVPAVPPYAELDADLMRRNPEVLAAERQSEAASSFIRSVDAALFPRLDATGGYQFTRNSNDAGFLLENRTNGWVVGLQLRYDIFNAFNDERASQRARLDKQRQELETQELVANLRSRLVQGYGRYEMGNALVALERTTLGAAATNARIAVERLRAGTITSVDARQAVLTVLESATRLTTAETETALAATEVLRLAGRIVR